MKTDLDRVIEYAEKLKQKWNAFEDVAARVAIQEVIDHCHNLQSEQPKVKDGTECIGMEVMYKGTTDMYFTNGEWYKCVGNYNELCAFISNRMESDGMHPDNKDYFDLDNPRQIQPK